LAVWVYLCLTLLFFALLVLFMIWLDRRQYLRGVLLNHEERTRKGMLRFTFMVSASFGVLSVVMMMENARWLHGQMMNQAQQGNFERGLWIEVSKIGMMEVALWWRHFAAEDSGF